MRKIHKEHVRIHPMRKHTTMSIPTSLYESVKDIIDSVPELGYTTPAEFCKDAIRRRISNIRKEYKTNKEDVDTIADIRKAIHDYEDYKAILDSVTCGIAVFSNPDGVLIAYNKRFLDILGYSEDDAQGKSFYDFVVSEDVLRVKKKFTAMVVGKGTDDKCTVRALVNGGATIPLEVDCSPYRVGDNIKGVSVLVRKVDEE